MPFREGRGPRARARPAKHRWAYACSKLIDEFLALAYWKETQAAGGHRASVQHRRPAADRPVRHGAADVRPPGAGRAADHGVRRRHAVAQLHLRWRRRRSADQAGGTNRAPSARCSTSATWARSRFADLAERVKAMTEQLLADPVHSRTTRPTRRASRTCRGGCRTSRRSVNLIGYEPKMELDEIIRTRHRAHPRTIRQPVETPYTRVGPMKVPTSPCLVIAVVVCCAGRSRMPRRRSRCEFSGGRVTLTRRTCRSVPSSRNGRASAARTIVNGDRIAGAPVTLELDGVSERQALDIILRGVSGYMLAARRARRARAPRSFDRIMILPTSVAPRNPPPAAAARDARPGGRGIVRRRSSPRQPEDQNPTMRDVAARQRHGDRRSRRPVPHSASSRVYRAGRPASAAANRAWRRTTCRPQHADPAPVVVTPSNPFGMPAGSSARPGVITPAPAPTTAARRTASTNCRGLSGRCS